MAAGAHRRIVLGCITRPYGTRGWVRIRSSTDPPENILRYAPWLVGRNGRWSRVGIAEGQAHRCEVIARFDGCHDRDEARGYLGCEVAVERSRLPDVDDGEFYWADLVGSRVSTSSGVHLGKVVRLLETGANDVMVVQGAIERLIPFLPGTVVQRVDIERGVMVVDWHPDD